MALEREGFSSLIGGANAGVPPVLLEDGQFYKGINVTSRGGLLRTRPRLVKIADLGIGGEFQGAGMYRLNSGDAVVLCCGGKVYHVPVAAPVAVEKIAFSAVDDLASFAQADKFMVVQSGVTDPEQWPLILDGASPVDNLAVEVFGDTANAVVPVSQLEHYTAKRVPIGTVMAYGHGRLFVTVNRIWNNGALTGGSAGWVTGLGQRFFVAGDVIQPENAGEILAFIEDDYTAEGGAFSTAAEMGFINAMHFFRNSSTGSGLGALVVFAREGVSAFAVNSPRAQWKTVDIGQVLFTGIGTESPFSVAAVNDDLVFRARDGLRTIKYTATQVASASGSLSCTPMSREVQYLMRLDDAYTRRRSSLAWADNRILISVAGVESLGAYFRALVSLDTSAVGSLQGSTAPAYDGAWTGLKFLQVLRGRYGDEDQHLLLARNAAGDVELWRLSEDAIYDGTDSSPACSVQTRAFSWGNPETLKQFDSAEVWLRDIRGPVTVTCYWRPDGYALWQQTNVRLLQGGETGLAQHRFRVTLVPPSTPACDPSSGMRLDRGTTMQFCLAWTGVATIEKTLFFARRVPEERQALDCAAETVIELQEGTAGVALDDLGTYEV